MVAISSQWGVMKTKMFARIVVGLQVDIGAYVYLVGIF